MHRKLCCYTTRAPLLSTNGAGSDLATKCNKETVGNKKNDDDSIISHSSWSSSLSLSSDQSLQSSGHQFEDIDSNGDIEDNKLWPSEEEVSGKRQN